MIELPRIKFYFFSIELTLSELIFIELTLIEFLKKYIESNISESILIE